MDLTGNTKIIKGALRINTPRCHVVAHLSAPPPPSSEKIFSSSPSSAGAPPQNDRHLSPATSPLRERRPRYVLPGAGSATSHDDVGEYRTSPAGLSVAMQVELADRAAARPSETGEAPPSSPAAAAAASAAAEDAPLLPGGGGGVRRRVVVSERFRQRSGSFRREVRRAAEETYLLTRLTLILLRYLGYSPIPFLIVLLYYRAAITSTLRSVCVNAVIWGNCIMACLPLS